MTSPAIEQASKSTRTEAQVRAERLLAAARRVETLFLPVANQSGVKAQAMAEMNAAISAMENAK